MPRDTTVSAEATLRALRIQLGLTQAQLAERLGVQPNTLARMERGVLALRPLFLAYTQALAGAMPPDQLPPPSPAPPSPAPAKRPRLRRWDAVFVLVQPLPDTTRCWHGPDPAQVSPEALLDDPCQGQRLQFVVLLPPSPHIAQRNAQTVTCERHASRALYWLQKQCVRWLRRIFTAPQENWYLRWTQTLRRHGEPIPPPQGG